MTFLVKVLLIIICGTLCQSNLPEYPRKKMHSFRYPISDVFETYTTPKARSLPDLFTHNAHYVYPLHSVLMNEIQYAPLYTSRRYKGLHNKEDPAQDVRPTPTVGTTDNNMRNTTTPRPLDYKEHLEPRVKVNKVNTVEGLKCNNPRHNDEKGKEVSRSPGHNAIYRNVQEYLKNENFKFAKAQEKNKFSMDSMKKWINKIANVKPLKYQKLLLSDSKAMESAVAGLNQRLVVAVKRLRIDNGSGLKSPKSKIQPSLTSSKWHRLHLNIARVYSPRQTPQKSAVILDTYSLPEQMPTLLLSGFPLSMKKTIMLPLSEADAKKYLRN